MKKIETPKVFISYCWSNDDYINKVVDFAKRLRSDGINVILDQFQMKLGNDMNNFMEKCVKDNTITNVLILLSPDYKLKADSRTGGAGIETQIISGEVYSNVENTKFIPIVFEKRGEDYSACIPTYLKQRRWLDMSEDSSYEEQYIELVRTLYGRDKFIENPLGSKPEWVDDDTLHNKNTQIIVNSYKAIKKDYGDERAISVSLEVVKNALKEVRNKFGNITSYQYDDFEKYYKYFDDVKLPYLSLVEEIKFDNNLGKKIHRFFSDLLKMLSESRTDYPVFIVFIKILLHELFIETTAILWNANNIESINYYTSSPYIDYSSYRKELSHFKEVFYSISDHEIYNISQFLGKFLHKDAKQGRYYYSGIAEFWMRNIPVKYLNKMDFVNADCLLTNISILVTGDYWFAISYIYLNDGESSVIKEIGISLKSSKLAKDYYLLFDTNKDDMKESLKTMLDYSDNHELRLCYSGTIYSIPLITNYIKIEELESTK